MVAAGPGITTRVRLHISVSRRRVVARACQAVWPTGGGRRPVSGEDKPPRNRLGDKLGPAAAHQIGVTQRGASA
ncbi:hypothetical protein E2562_028131 [Oryza meyeriana var. granulata]|uniref:Uncharacterized protein n=1 Tax=Oryza meyeriana var. granulata TaxID=110450 RepID=A0A6G1CAK9_9ORYZ|nr:hypothetical protein E2562_028131 [Oryza meyeriana var. granulata]